MLPSYSRFWAALRFHLARVGIATAKRTDRVYDIGFGRGRRYLIDSDGRLTHPNGCFVPVRSIDVTSLAEAIEKELRLSKTEKLIMKLMEGGHLFYRHRLSRMVLCGRGRSFQASTIDRLCLIGLVEEVDTTRDDDSRTCDVSYRALVPNSVAQGIDRAKAKGVCKRCGCTEEDCTGCVMRGGLPCSWATEAMDLCTNCVGIVPVRSRRLPAGKAVAK